MAWADRYVVVCPECHHIMSYKSCIDWILHTPFHWFDKRRIKCEKCGKKFYAKLTKIKKAGQWKR